MNRALTLRTGQCHVQRYMRPLLQRIENGTSVAGRVSKARSLSGSANAALVTVRPRIAAGRRSACSRLADGITRATYASCTRPGPTRVLGILIVRIVGICRFSPSFRSIAPKSSCGFMHCCAPLAGYSAASALLGRDFHAL